MPWTRALGLLVPLLFAAYYAHELGLTWRLQGGASRLCWDILGFQYDQSGGLILTLPFLTTYWVETCKSIIPELPQEQRTLLEALFDKPLSYDVILSAMELARHRVAKPLVSASEKEAMRKALLESPPKDKLALGPSAEELTQAVLEHSGGIALDWLEKHKNFELLGLPRQEPTVEPAEVGRALRDGRLVRFDATKVLPPKTFNTTLHKLSWLHGEAGDEIPIHSYMHQSRHCRGFAFANRLNFPFGALACPSLPTVGEIRMQFPNPVRMPVASRIGLRRLPNYISEDALIRDLGLTGVERPEGQIIMGHAIGDTHWDEQDNIFIQASGIAVVLGVPPDYTDAITGDEKSSSKSSGMDWDHWLAADEVRAKAIPWYYMVLKPGDGIAIPSRAFHAVYGSHNRASLQVFLEPQFKGMRFDTNPHSYWNKETPTRQAIRNLFFKTIGRLWDKQGVAMVAQGGCIEYL